MHTYACGLIFIADNFVKGSLQKIEICSISSRSRVLALRPCPKLEMFCPSVTTQNGCSKVLMNNHGMSFFFFNWLEI